MHAVVDGDIAVDGGTCSILRSCMHYGLLLCEITTPPP